jgi:hypothetical protein
MAKVTQPLFSLTAKGGLGSSIVFTGSTGGARAILYVKPKAPGIPATKARFTAACKSWKTLTKTAKALWTAAGQSRGISGFSAYLSDWLRYLIGQGSAIWDSGATIWDSDLASWDVLTIAQWDAGAAVWDGGGAIWTDLY